ncbi:hypothetical protein V8F06_009613 [Rhypophila decipiens]
MFVTCEETLARQLRHGHGRIRQAQKQKKKKAIKETLHVKIRMALNDEVFSLNCNLRQIGYELCQLGTGSKELQNRPLPAKSTTMVRQLTGYNQQHIATHVCIHPAWDSSQDLASQETNPSKGLVVRIRAARPRSHCRTRISLPTEPNTKEKEDLFVLNSYSELEMSPSVWRSKGVICHLLAKSAQCSVRAHGPQSETDFILT